MKTQLAIFRAILVLHALGVLTQSVFAGQFLSGSDSAVVFHEVTGWCIATLGLLQTASALTLLKQHSGGLWFVVGSFALLIGEALQLGTGYGRFLNVHIPLAVVILAGLVGMMGMAFRTESRTADLRS